MPDTDLPPELSRFVPLSRLASTGLEFDVVATPAECARVALRLQVVAVRALAAHYVLHRRPGGLVEAEGVLKATLVQDCIVSLEPFETTSEERFVVHFVPAARIEDDPDELLDPDAVDEIPYEGDRIDLGEATVEQLALGLDPFPRRPGVQLPPEIDSADSAPAAEPAAAIHPFAALQKKLDPD